MFSLVFFRLNLSDKISFRAAGETREFNGDILEREFDGELYRRARGGGGRGRILKFGGGGTRGTRKALSRVASAAFSEYVFP
jgi:hypothetical protein